jgi:hypothetical protein
MFSGAGRSSAPSPVSQASAPPAAQQSSGYQPGQVAFTNTAGTQFYGEGTQQNPFFSKGSTVRFF